jgi:DNA-binding MarR family transcriptional regulator
MTAVPEEVDDVAWALDRLGTWIRRTTDPVEWNSVALSRLDRLVRQGPHRVTDLVAAERISQPGMTGLIGRMEAAGLVTRRPDPSDGRATLVSATDAGAAYLEELHRSRARTIAARLDQLSPAYRRALGRAVDALAALAEISPRDIPPIPSRYVPGLRTEGASREIARV